MEYILYWQTVKDYRGNTEEHSEISGNKKYLESRKKKIEKTFNGGYNGTFYDYLKSKKIKYIEFSCDLEIRI